MQTAKTLRYKQVVIDSPLHSLLVPNQNQDLLSSQPLTVYTEGKKEKKRRKMEGGSAATTNGNEDSAKKGLDGTGLDLPLNRHGNLKSASSDQSLKDILLQIKSSKTPAVVNYGASWCGVCSQILPSFCQLSNNFPKLSFIYADIDECPETTQHIRYTPTFHFYRDGEKVDEMYGAGEERLHDRLWLHS